MDAKNAIVCYLDILGYKEFVKKTGEISAEIYERFRGIEQRMINFLRTDTKQIPLNHIFDNITFQVMSDSMLLVLDLDAAVKSAKDDLEELNKGLSQKLSGKSICMEVFLNSISFLSIDLITTFKLLIRGGMTRGEYCQRSLVDEKNQFISGKALVEAVELEKEAGMPCVLVSDDLHKDIMGIWKKEKVDKHFIRSESGLYFLDFYYFMESVGFKKRQRNFFEEIKRFIESKIKDVKDKGVLKKYCWFSFFHNRKVKESFIENPQNFEIEIPDYLSNNLGDPQVVKNEVPAGFPLSRE